MFRAVRDGRLKQLERAVKGLRGEKRARALVEAGYEHSDGGFFTALMHCAFNRTCGKPREGGPERWWLGQLVFMLGEVHAALGDEETAAWVNARHGAEDCYTALHCLAYCKRARDGPQLAAVAALLAHGADATLGDAVSRAARGHARTRRRHQP